jgi:predicted ribosome quality control (RQC) complex YloA/Tae2 family protein
MDQKRELTSVDLVALVGELRGYVGAKVDKAYLYGDDFLRLKMRDFDRGRVELLVEVGDVKRAHVARPEHVPSAPGRPPNFAKMLRNRISGADLADVTQHGFDRVLTFEFRREDRDTRIVAELFGEGNVAVLDQNGEVVDALNTVRLKSRTVAPGAPYGYPSERPRPDEYDVEDFAAAMRESDTDVVRTLATQMDFGGLWAEELCTRAGVEKTLAIADADDETLRAVFDAVQRLFDELESGLDPRVYYEREDGERGRRVDVTPIPLEERADLDAEAFDSFNAAVDDYFTNLDTSEEEAESAEEPTRPDFESEIQKQQRIVDQQEGAIEEFEAQAEREREKAELLYGNYDLVDDILTTVHEARAAGHSWDDIGETLDEGAEQGVEAAEFVVGVDGESGTVTVILDDHRIALDPDAGVEKNADRLYTEAKRVEEKRAGAEEALAETRAELERVEARREEWEAEGDEAETESEAEPEDVDWLTRPSIPLRSEERWHERFRWFRTSDGFLVIGGRSADQNEELVEKYMDPYDRFFHAQAHGGPATVLKTSEPSEPSREVEVPDASLEQAAQFAVTYSSVWKDGRFSGDAYMVDPDQVSKTPESGEYLETGGFAIRGERTYFRDTPVACAVGVACEPETRVLGGPPDAVVDRVETHVTVEPGRYAQGDVAKRAYRRFRDAFADESFVRKVASPDRIQHFLPPGTSRIVE